MIFQLAAMLILICFYALYIAKFLIQKKQSIETNQMGKGNKPTKVLFNERIMSVATVLAIVVEVISIFLSKTYLPTGLRISRNPAFVAFDLLYLAICLLFFNIPLLMISIWAAVMLHIQILQEEVHMHNMFGEVYDEYKKHTCRYLGRR